MPWLTSVPPQVPDGPFGFFAFKAIACPMRIVSRAGVSDACHKSITFYSLQARSGIWRPTSAQARYARITTEISKPGRVNGSEDLRRVSRLF